MKNQTQIVLNQLKSTISEIDRLQSRYATIERNYSRDGREEGAAVSERAVIARINRKLRRDGSMLHRCRKDSQWYRDLGDFYEVDCRNNLTGIHINLATYAREMGVLKASEALAD